MQVCFRSRKFDFWHVYSNFRCGIVLGAPPSLLGRTEEWRTDGQLEGDINSSLWPDVIYNYNLQLLCYRYCEQHFAMNLISSPVAHLPRSSHNPLFLYQLPETHLQPAVTPCCLFSILSVSMSLCVLLTTLSTSHHRCVVMLVHTVWLDWSIYRNYYINGYRWNKEFSKWNVLGKKEYPFIFKFDVENKWVWLPFCTWVLAACRSASNCSDRMCGVCVAMMFGVARAVVLAALPCMTVVIVWFGLFP